MTLVKFNFLPSGMIIFYSNDSSISMGINSVLCKLNHDNLLVMIDAN